jgi:formate hydrogenlyase subunit 3
MIALLLIAAPLLPFILMLFFKRDRLPLARCGVGLRL